MRRRARFLRKARELAYRDLGGLVFNLHRFGQRNDALVMAKLTTVGHIDAELRTLEAALEDQQHVTVLREAGITACARCAAIHSSEDHFCPNCGLSLEPRADLPIAGAPAMPPTAASETAASAPQAPAPSEPPAPAPASAPISAGDAKDASPASAGTAEEEPEPVTVSTPAVSGPPPVPARAPDPARAPNPARAPVPARAPDPAPARHPLPATPGGRSPTPPRTPSSAPPAQRTSGEDEPTEILHPPSAGT